MLDSLERYYRPSRKNQAEKFPHNIKVFLKNYSSGEVADEFSREGEGNKPSETWAEIKTEEATVSDLYKSYAVMLAVIVAISQFIGSSIIGYSSLGTHIRIGITTAVGSALVSYILSL